MIAPKSSSASRRSQTMELLRCAPATAADPALPVRQRCPLEGERRRRFGGGSCHFDAGFSKFTAGGVEICASFCTVKLGLT